MYGFLPKAVSPMASLGQSGTLAAPVGQPITNPVAAKVPLPASAAPQAQPFNRSMIGSPMFPGRAAYMQALQAYRSANPNGGYQGFADQWAQQTGRTLNPFLGRLRYTLANSKLGGPNG